MPVPFLNEPVTHDRTTPCKSCGAAVPYTRHPFDYCSGCRKTKPESPHRVKYTIVKDPEGAFQKGAEFAKGVVDDTLDDGSFTLGTILESAGVRYKVVPKNKASQKLEQVES